MLGVVEIVKRMLGYKTIKIKFINNQLKKLKQNLTMKINKNKMICMISMIMLKCLKNGGNRLLKLIKKIMMESKRKKLKILKRPDIK